MKTSAEVNAGIERINSLLSEISSIGWDICQYFEEKYNVENYDWDKKIPDKDAACIAQQASNCGMIETWNEFSFGNLFLADDGLLKSYDEWIVEFLRELEKPECKINAFVNITNGYDNNVVKQMWVKRIYIDIFDELCVEDAEHSVSGWYKLDPKSKVQIIEEIKKANGKG